MGKSTRCRCARTDGPGMARGSKTDYSMTPAYRRTRATDNRRQPWLKRMPSTSPHLLALWTPRAINVQTDLYWVVLWGIRQLAHPDRARVRSRGGWSAWPSAQGGLIAAIFPRGHRTVAGAVEYKIFSSNPSANCKKEAPHRAISGTGYSLKPAGNTSEN